MANEVIKGMGFHHIALKAKDFDRSKAFYEALGCRPVLWWGEGDKRAVMLDIGDGGRIELFAGGCKEAAENEKWMHFAFCVDDVQTAYDTAIAAGAVSVTEPKLARPCTGPTDETFNVAFVAGPDGEQIEFFRLV